ncbi:hypothetical protein EVAR_27061_1 [Eumeta japonica]|uniref:Uncharacterized protein n=1 Tax=Eumeta variegata TaxID=151549 RepID=A0A4C1ZTI4_EUMVA|nr:hypothetical protein EVAR_27061_1 [Eumeta japonica]
MGKVSQVRMRPGCTPSKFGCQEDRRKRACSSTERPYIVKKQRMEIIAECLNEPEQSCAQNSSIEDTPHTSSASSKTSKTNELAGSMGLPLDNSFAVIYFMLLPTLRVWISSSSTPLMCMMVPHCGDEAT